MHCLALGDARGTLFIIFSASKPRAAVPRRVPSPVRWPQLPPACRNHFRNDHISYAMLTADDLSRNSSRVNSHGFAAKLFLTTLFIMPENQMRSKYQDAVDRMKYESSTLGNAIRCKYCSLFEVRDSNPVSGTRLRFFNYLMTQEHLFICSLIPRGHGLLTLCTNRLCLVISVKWLLVFCFVL